MSIRTKGFRHEWTHKEVRAVQITEKNLTDLVAYICRNGGAATGHLGRNYNVTPKGKTIHRRARIRIKQLTSGGGKNGYWTKLDWRVAYIGDWIVKDVETGQFVRVKAEDFDALYD